MYYGQTCVWGSHILWVTCLMRGYVLHEDISYRITYHEVRNVFHDDMFCYVLV